MQNTDNVQKTVHLPVWGAPDGELDIEKELAVFEAEERKRLGLESGKEHWRDEVAGHFTAEQRAKTTILISGLTMAHDYLLEGGLAGLGYTIKNLDVPDNDALRYGKEFGNRGQCNPTYFTVGNLVKYLCYLRDEQGMSTKDIVDNTLFLKIGRASCRE